MRYPTGSQEEAFRERVYEILGALALQWPSLSVRVDLWRQGVVSQADGYSDTQVEVWIRLAENVPAFRVSTVDRWYQKEEGVIYMNQDWLILPAHYTLEPTDNVIVDGIAWMVIDSAEQAGVSKVKIDLAKSRFKMPARTLPTYRQMGMKARIT
jgi:hypothetical protein